MFYLKEFLKSVGEAPIRGACFLILTCFLAMGLTHRSIVSSLIGKLTPEKMTNPYFVAVLDGAVDVNQITRTLSKLPGVSAVDERETNKGQEKLKGLLAQLGNDYSLSENLMNFKSLRVVMSPTLSPESLDFVRDQFIKMGGKDHVSVTPVKYPEVTSIMKSHPFYSFLAKAGDWGVLGVLFIFWVTSYWLCYDVFRSRSYLIEKFQRKKYVAAKTIGSGLGIILMSFVGIGLWNGTLRILDLIILLMIFSVFGSFSMQNWRWKPTL